MGIPIHANVTCHDGGVGKSSHVIVDLVKEQVTHHHWRAKEIIIETEQPQAVQGDGEIREDRPITIKVLPAAMKVLVPGGTVS